MRRDRQTIHISWTCWPQQPGGKPWRHFYGPEVKHDSQWGPYWGMNPTEKAVYNARDHWSCVDRPLWVVWVVALNTPGAYQGVLRVPSQSRGRSARYRRRRPLIHLLETYACDVARALFAGQDYSEEPRYVGAEDAAELVDGQVDRKLTGTELRKLRELIAEEVAALKDKFGELDEDGQRVYTSCAEFIEELQSMEGGGLSIAYVT